MGTNQIGKRSIKQTNKQTNEPANKRAMTQQQPIKRCGGYKLSGRSRQSVKGPPAGRNKLSKGWIRAMCPDLRIK